MHIQTGKHFSKFLQRTYQILTMKILKEGFWELFIENYTEIPPKSIPVEMGLENIPVLNIVFLEDTSYLFRKRGSTTAVTVILYIYLDYFQDALHIFSTIISRFAWLDFLRLSVLSSSFSLCISTINLSIITVNHFLNMPNINCSSLDETFLLQNICWKQMRSSDILLVHIRAVISKPVTLHYMSEEGR